MQTVLMTVNVLAFGHMQLHRALGLFPEQIFDKAHFGPIGTAIGETHGNMLPDRLHVHSGSGDDSQQNIAADWARDLEDTEIVAISGDHAAGRGPSAVFFSSFPRSLSHTLSGCSLRYR